VCATGVLFGLHSLSVLSVCVALFFFASTETHSLASVACVCGVHTHTPDCSFVTSPTRAPIILSLSHSFCRRRHHVLLSSFGAHAFATMSTFFFVFLFLYNWVAGASWKRNKGNNPRGHGPGKRRRRGMYRLAFTGCFFFFRSHWGTRRRVHGRKRKKKKRMQTMEGGDEWRRDQRCAGEAVRPRARLRSKGGDPDLALGRAIGIDVHRRNGVPPSFTYVCVCLYCCCW
jgi:hypothetical protein